MADGTYAGNPANYPTTIRFAEDGEEPNETDMIAPTVEDLADRTAYLHARGTVGYGVVASYNAAGVETFNSATLTDSATAFIDLDGLVVGDKVFVDVTTGFALDPGYVETKIVAVDDTGGTPTTTDVAHQKLATNSGASGTQRMPWSMCALHTVTETGDTRVKLQVGTDVTAVMGAGLQFRAWVVRAFA